MSGHLDLPWSWNVLCGLGFIKVTVYRTLPKILRFQLDGYFCSIDASLVLP